MQFLIKGNMWQRENPAEKNSIDQLNLVAGGQAGGQDLADLSV